MTQETECNCEGGCCGIRGTEETEHSYPSVPADNDNDPTFDEPEQQVIPPQGHSRDPPGSFGNQRRVGKKLQKTGGF